MRLWLILLSCSLLSACLQTQIIKEDAAPPPVIHHVVLIWLKPEFQGDYITALKANTERLREIPGIRTLAVGKAIASERNIVDDSFDLAVLMTFASQAAMDEYIGDERHQAFLRNFVVGKVTKLVIYDF